MLFLLLLAALIRAPGLGKWCLGADEFYLSQSIRFILEKGLPEFPSGGYYFRGIGLQYLTALVATVVKERELQVRILPFLFGVMTMPVFYKLCRLFLPRTPSALAVLVLVLSSWHIEFSRFGRFYAPFLFCFVLFIYFLYKGYWQGSGRDAIASWIVAFLSVFIFEGAIFMPLLFLLVLVREESKGMKQRFRILLLVGLLLSLNYVVNGVGYRNLGVEDALPEVATSVQKGGMTALPFAIPGTKLLETTYHSTPLMAGYALLVVLAIGLFSRQLRRKFEIYDIFLSAVAVILPLVHLYGLLFLLLLFVALYRREWFRWAGKELGLYLAYFLISAGFWAIVLQTSGNLDQSMGYLFGYPPIKYAIVIPFRKTVPIWGALALVGILFSIVRNIMRKESPSSFILLITLVCIIMISFFNTPYRSTRYSFFLLPLLILLPYIEVHDYAVGISARNNGTPLARFSFLLLLVPLAAFLASDDFHPRHILDVSSAEFNFRLGKYRVLEDHWYPRRDFKSPAVFVNQAYGAGDQIVIDAIPFAAYLRHAYLFYCNTRSPWFRAYSRKGGTEEVWTGSPMVYSSTRSLDAIIPLVPVGRERSLWFITGETLAEGTSVAETGNRAPIKVNIEHRYRGLDDRMNVYQLTRIEG